MAGGVTLTSNKDKVFAQLRKLIPAATVAMAAANRQTADEMAATAKSFAPVKTGKLRDSIRVEDGPRPGSYYVKAGGPTTTKEVRGGSGVAYDYALGVEFGTKPHTNAGEFSGSENPGIRRVSFFWTSYRLVKKRMKSRNSRALNKAVKQALS